MTVLHEIRLLGTGGEYMETATLLEWRARLGDLVKKGDVLATVETAKAVTEIPAEVDGALLCINFKAGDEVAVGAVLGIVGPATGRFASDTEQSSTPDATPSEVRQNADAGSCAAPPQEGRVIATPLARRVAKDRGIDLTRVMGSGPSGRIKARDLSAGAEAVSGPKIRDAPRAGRSYVAAMAAHMARTLEIPQFSVSMDVDGSHLLACRKAIKSRGGLPTVNDLLILSVARTLARHRALNAVWQDGQSREMDAIDIGVAMTTSLGLVVPVIRNADKLNLLEIAEAVVSLRKLADAMRLDSKQLSGAGFTLSNLGAFGVSAFTAIVNPPQVAILAVPAFAHQAVFDDRRIESRPLARLTLSADHRALDGATTAAFLRDLKVELQAGDFRIQ